MTPPLQPRLAELARVLDGARVSYNGEQIGTITHIDTGDGSYVVTAAAMRDGRAFDTGLLIEESSDFVNTLLPPFRPDHCPCCDKPIDFEGWRTSASWAREWDYEVLCFACGLFLAEHFESWTRRSQ